jgi:type IV secretion system protein VirD4
MDNFEFPHPRVLIGTAALIAGLALSYGLNWVWPYIYPSTQKAFMCAGAVLGILAIADGYHGLAQKAFYALAAIAALIWIWLAFSPIYDLLSASWAMVERAKAMGYPPAERIKMAGSFYQYQTHRYAWAYETSLAVGLVPALGLLIGARLGPSYLRRNRTITSGPWTAGYMAGAQLRYLKSLAVGIPLGLKDGALARYEPNPAKGWRGGHHLAIAGTRAGKGVSVVIPAIVDHDGPVVCLDIKGENFAVTRRSRAEQGRRVVVLNPFSVIEPARDGYNPLDYIRPDHLVRDIDVLAEGLVRPEPGAGAHFSEMARQTIAGVIEVVMTVNPPPERTINTVTDILLSAGLEDRLKTWAQAPERYGRHPAQAAAALLAAGDNESGGVKTTIKKAFEWARSEEMRAFLAHSTASMDQLLDDEIDVYIAVPLDQLGAQAIFMRLMINIILGTVVRQDGRRVAAKRILMVLDEFVRLGRMEKLLDIANVAAGSGVEALFVTQDKGQIETVYGKSDTDSLIGSCVTTRIFGLGRMESNTAEWAAAALGERTIITQSIQAPTRLGDPQRVSTSEQRQRLMTADEILSMSADEMLCLIGSKPPLRLKALVSHAHRAYRHKLDPNPTRRA